MFQFIKYIKPGWYYSLGSGATDLGKTIDPADENLLDLPTNYETKIAAEFDTNYQRWLKGVPGKRSNAEENEIPTLCDEYKFVRRHFGIKWIVFVWALRTLELNNPFREFSALMRSRKTEKARHTKRRRDWKPDLEDFDLGSISPVQKVSVIVPTLNRYEFLSDVLKDLTAQDYKNFEVIVVDQSDKFEPHFYEDFELDLNVIRQEEKALWLARNTAIENSTGDLILMSEDDIRFAPDFITKHVRAINFFEADVSCGIFFPEGSVIPESRNLYRLSDQLATGNAMIRRRVFESVGLFDRQFEKQRSGDGEFGLRAHLAGFRLIANPEATCFDIKAPVGGLRHFGSWDSWRPSGILSPRPVPSILYLTRKYFGDRVAIYQLCKSFLPSIVPYRYKRSGVCQSCWIVSGDRASANPEHTVDQELDSGD